MKFPFTFKFGLDVSLSEERCDPLFCRTAEIPITGEAESYFVLPDGDADGVVLGDDELRVGLYVSHEQDRDDWKPCECIRVSKLIAELTVSDQLILADWFDHYSKQIRERGTSSMIDLNDVMPQAVAAEKLGVSPQAINERLSSGSAQVIEVHGKKWVSLKQLKGDAS